MTNEELKKKIESIIRNAKRDFAYCVPEEWAVKVLADALIAAGIGDVKEAERRAARAERALLRACKVNTIFAEPDVPNILAERVLYEFYIRQSEKELAEDGKE